MSWWIEKSYTWPGPTFEVTEPANRPWLLNFMGLSGSRPLKLEYGPKAAKQTKPHKGPLGDYVLVQGAMTVSGRFRELVERFEPDTHFFALIRLYRSNDEPIDGEWFSFSARQDLDCVLTDNDPRWFGKQPYEDGKWYCDVGMAMSKDGPPRRLSKPRIKGRHLWTGGILFWDELFFSDEFYEAFRKAKLRNMPRYAQPFEDLARPWDAQEQMGPLLHAWRAYVAADRDVERDMVR